jgi:S1-C subfamily serine protease
MVKSLPSDDHTLRPTVVVRRGTSQGSGTIIAAADGEALVLTAAHVVRSHEPILVELHRYNFGRERTRAVPGAWPRVVPARLAASDSAADLAVLHIKNLTDLPFVARLAVDRPQAVQPAPDTEVVSVGIDLGTKLTTWTTRLVEVLWFELDDSDQERPFLITVHTPEHGRSGGGLFSISGELIGVCVGHAPLIRGRRMGVFASAHGVRGLLDDHDLDGLLARSERRRGLAPGSSRGSKIPSGLTPTRDEVVPKRVTGQRSVPSEKLSPPDESPM